MPDKLGLKNEAVPIQKRYDDFAQWCNENNYWSGDVIATELGVELSIVEVFTDLAQFEEEEMMIITEKSIDVDSLFIIRTYEKEIRYRIYDNWENLTSKSQRLTAIKEFGDKILFGDYQDHLNRVSIDSWNLILKYITERDIVNGTITKRFRSMLYNIIRYKKESKEITPSMCEWVARALLHDSKVGLNIFSNDDLKNSHKADHELFATVLDRINNFIEE